MSPSPCLLQRYCMIAQLSQSEPWGRPSSSRSGVRSAGSLARKSDVPFLPHMSTSSKSSPAARTNTRAERLLTLGKRTLSVLSAIFSSVGVLGLPILRERLLGSHHQRLDRVGEMDLRDVVVAPLGPDPVRLEQDVGVGVPGRGNEAIGRELDEQPERILEVDRVHEPAVLDAAVADPALLQAL